MSRAASEEVYNLVRSMTKAEKRYFKNYAGMGTTGKQVGYIKLFDKIGSQKKYNEAKILRGFSKINPFQFANQKKYLAELILESLRWYHSRHSVDAQLWATLTEMEVLYEKRLLKQCLKVLHKAKAKAIQYDKQRHLLELLTWEERLAVETLSTDRSEKRIDEIFKENLVTAESVKNVIVLRELQNATNRFFRKGGLVRNKEDIAELNKIVTHPLIRNEKKLTTYHELNHYFNIKGMYFMLLSDWKNSYVWRKKHIDLIESHPEQLKEETRLYVSALNSFILCCEYTNKNEELEIAFEKVKQMLLIPACANNSGILLRLLGCCSSVMHNYIQHGEFEKGMELLKNIESSFIKVLPEINRSSEISFYYTFSYITFGAENYKRSLYWLNKILNATDTGMRDDIRVSALLLNLILHYELGNESQLEYYVRSTYRFLYKRHRLFKIETIMLDLIRKKLPKTGSQKELMDVFTRLKQEIEKLAKDPQQKRSLEYFDFISWLESKISKRKFAEVVRAKGIIKE